MDEIYNHPLYYDIIFDWDIEKEVNFMEDCFRKYFPDGVERVLDIPCGTGRHLFKLVKRGYVVTGIDYNENMLRFLVGKARLENYSNFNVVLADMRHFSISPYFQSAICMLDSFRYLIKESHMLDALTCIGGALVRGGIFILDVGLVRNRSELFSIYDRWSRERDGIKIVASYSFLPSAEKISNIVVEEVKLEVFHGNFVEEVIQRTPKKLISLEELLRIVKKTKIYEVIHIYSDFDISDNNESEASPRLLAVLRKTK